MAYVVNLDAFHGPLDLLLYLIEENELDIYDIPIASISDQYMDYLQATGEFDLEKLGDFLIMASYLLNLKSRMLLPRGPELQEEEGENGDPRDELVKKLLDYKKYRLAAEYLQKRVNGEVKRVFYRSGSYEVEQATEIKAEIEFLLRAYQSLLADKIKAAEFYKLPEGDVNISDKMDEIVALLESKQEGISFQDLFAGAGNIRQALGLFLALLELVRQQKVQATQEQSFGRIKLCLRVAI
ncbi:MAG: segregation/condensation protein A [Syntrophomonas sp.]